MKYLTIDIETTALKPENGQILEICMMFDDLSKPPTYEHKRLLVDNGIIRGEIFALKLNKELLVEIAEQGGVAPLTLFSRTIDWINGLFPDGKRITLAGKNVGRFDWPWLMAHTDLPLYASRFHHRIIDPGSMYLNALDTEIPDLKTCLARGSIEHGELHTAVEDCKAVINLIRRSLTE